MAATAAARRTAPARRGAARAAPARRSPARRAPAPKRRAAPTRRPRSNPTPIPGRLVPIAVGRTAGAVGGIADSGLVVRLTRGRLWIGALAALLIGIVALNVLALSFSASSSKTAAAAEQLAQQNSALRAELASKLSTEQVRRTASNLGLVVAAAGSIRYLEPTADDSAEAARRLRDGELGDSGDVVVPVADPAVSAAPVADPAIDPALADPAASSAEAPVAGETVETEAVEASPATTTAPTDPALVPVETGGVASP
jgi:hypothetical protein